MCSLNTVSRELGVDLQRMEAGLLSKSVFLGKYGHLRPGTYDIMSYRYDEDFEKYFCADYSALPGQEGKKKSIPFDLGQDCTNKIDTVLQECGLTCSSSALFDFIRGGIEGREYSKFMFSKTLSDILVLMERFGSENHVSRESVSFLPISIIQDLYLAVDCRDIDLCVQEAIEV